jgi:hypothetical protein
MPTIVVNTAADTIANDGVTSLREAVTQAAGMAGNVNIVFDTATFYNFNTFAVTTIDLEETLVLSGKVTIDGSLFYAGNFYSVRISGAGLSTNAITVNAGATATVRDLRIEGSSGNLIKAKYGTDGHNGTDGLQGSPNYVNNTPYHGQYDSGLSGGHATDGRDAPNDAESGRDAVGAILNRGTLTLERVDIQSFKTEGGAGGLGGEGGRGGGGGNGFNAPNDDALPGQGGNAGNSGDGARGGDGGIAVSGIYNAGTVTLRDVGFSGLNARGGNGGQGGDGQNGGHGGNTGEGYKLETISAVYGGNGGNGSNGGNGGNGGAAATALYNVGTVIWDGIQSGVSAGLATGGLGASKGEGGDVGIRGINVNYGVNFGYQNDPHHGHNGLIAGVDGINGNNGGKGDFIGANAVIGASFIVDSAREVISEQDDATGRLVYFNVSLKGGSQTATESVKWEIVPGKGFSVADFEQFNGVSPALSGTLTFEGSTTNKLFGFRVAQDGKAEGLESLTIKLSDPQGGVLGWSKEVTVYITDGSTDGEAPTSLKLSDTSLKENSKKNTTLGELSTKDGDKGDHFTYELLKDAGGRYKLVGDKIKVADASLLDYEQSHRHTIKVRSTDLFGNSIDKKFKITLENVDPEKLKGNDLNNKLFGGAEADTINGGYGNDTLKGNGDADRFVFDSGLDATGNVDHIIDFKHDLDKIVLDKDIFKKLSGKSLSDDAFHDKATAHDNSDRILYQKKTGMLFYDADGKKDAHDPILFAVLDNHAKIDAGDFFIV